MNKSKYKVYNGKSFKKIIENFGIFTLITMFIVGIIIGAATIKSNSEINDKISILFNNYSSLRVEQGILKNFLNSLAVNGLFIIFNVFFGFSLIGYPFVTLIPLIKGLGLGTICGYLYSTYKLTGLGYSITMIYPGAILSSLAIILACNDSCRYSKNAYLKAIKGAGQFEKDETQLFITRQLIFLGMCIPSSGIDALFCELFSRFFEL